ncbi:hypothetical protein H9P43_002104 [Blastocladiella emersonii ATCC 22665]|nr:hypothetical protein H9P43_002104 [Blastocladiella emersonii ATCC 22665]
MTVHTLPASDFFRFDKLPGLAFHRSLYRKNVTPKLHKLNAGSSRCHLEATRVFIRYEELHGTRELALLLESPQLTAMVYRAVSDRRQYLRNPDGVTDLRVREAVATYYRPKKGGAVNHPQGAEVYYRELGVDLRAAILEAVERDLDAFLNILADELTDDFVAQRDYACPPGNAHARYALSTTLFARRNTERAAFDRLARHFRGVVDADLAALLDNPNDMDSSLRLFATLPKLVTRYAERNVIAPNYTCPSIITSAESVKPVVRVSFEAFRSMFVEGRPPVPALPPAANPPTKSIGALIGTKTAPPAAIESITPQDVERVEAWLRDGVARGLASWDAMLSVMYHFVHPNHLWKDQAIVVNGRLETRKIRWFAGYISAVNRKTVQIYSYEGGVRPSAGFSDLSSYELRALRARIDEWHLHRAGPLAHQFGAMSLHGGGPVSRDVYDYATATIDDSYAYSYGGEEDCGVDFDGSSDDDEARDDEYPCAVMPPRVSSGEKPGHAVAVPLAAVTEPKDEAGKVVASIQLPATTTGMRLAEVEEPEPAPPAEPPVYHIPSNRGW